VTRRGTRPSRASPARARRQETWLAFVNRPVTFGLLALGRRLGDVVRLPGIGRLVNDAEVARAILVDGTSFNSHDPGSFGHMITRVLGPRALINMDGPEHQSLKRHLMEVFSARYVEEVTGHATGAMVDRLRDDLQAGRTVDFAAFMRQYGGAMACALVGVSIAPADRHAAHEEIFQIATGIMSLAGIRRRVLSPADAARARAYAGRLSAMIRDSYDRDNYDRDGVPGRSVTQALRARGLAFGEVEGLVSVVMVGATELIIYGLPRILAVLVDSGALPRLADAPERLNQAIDEAYRVVTPSNVVLRAVAADREVHGHRFRRGERVLVAIRNVMRQPKHFADPGLFDLDRVIPPHLRRLPFGAGAHNCLGISLALAETRHVLSALLALGGRLAILRRGRNRGKIYPGYTELLIRLDPRPAPAPTACSNGPVV
jgi:cytochrome P450